MLQIHPRKRTLETCNHHSATLTLANHETLHKVILHVPVHLPADAGDACFDAHMDH